MMHASPREPLHEPLQQSLQESLYDIPALYDRVVAPGPCESFYDALARAAGGPVLDLACGSGRLTVPLACRGHAVTGLDASDAMLARARDKAAARGVAVAFVHGDMRRFALRRRFALVIVTCNSLAHLARRDDIVACLACAARHLLPGAMLAFDVVNPDLRLLGRVGPTRLDLGPNPSAAVAVEERASYDPVAQLRELRWRVLEPHGPARELAPLVLRQFFPQELPLLLEAAGLELVARHGDFAGGALTARSLMQVCLARRRRRSGRRAAAALSAAPAARAR